MANDFDIKMMVKSSAIEKKSNSWGRLGSTSLSDQPIQPNFIQRGPDWLCWLAGRSDFCLEIIIFWKNNKNLFPGTYVNLQDKAGDTNLIFASRGGHKQIVEALIKKYADVDTRGKDGKSFFCSI